MAIFRRSISEQAKLSFQCLNYKVGIKASNPLFEIIEVTHLSNECFADVFKQADL